MNRGVCIIAMSCLFVSLSVSADKAEYINFEGEHLRYGKVIWLLNCETCHAYGVADAPVPMNKDEWRYRLKQGRSVLYDHAINGYYGPDDSMMPARGGNKSLTDDEVKAAVDYMAKLADFYIKQYEEMKNDN